MEEGEDGGSCFGGGPGAGASGFLEVHEGEGDLWDETEVGVLQEVVHGVVGDGVRGGQIHGTLRKKEG